MKAITHTVLQAVFAHRPFRHILCWRAHRSEKRVAITFDDGPNEHTTPRVLKILEDAHIQCTFFVLGRELAKCPEMLRMIVDAGHEIGLHGFDHSARGIRGQIRKCEAELTRYGISARLFRPALGRRGLGSLLWIRCRGYATVLWSFDAHDSMRSEGKWKESTPNYRCVRGGEIILMHDDNPVCVRDLPDLIAVLRERGLQAVTVTELLP